MAARHVELLFRHPEARIQSLVAPRAWGSPSPIWAALAGFCDSRSRRTARGAGACGCPPRRTAGMKTARAEPDKGAKVIDYSGDFRFNSAEDYAEYALAHRQEPRCRS